MAIRIPPIIASQPTGRTVNVGQSATFTVAADGTAPLAYQWRRNGADIPGATGSTHTIEQVATADAGTYDAVVSNAGGSTTSRKATL